MFGINFSEIILICVVALIVLGPKQLPGLATRIGLIIYGIRNYFKSLKHEIYYNSGVNELINTKNELIKTYASVRKNVMPYNKIEDEIPANNLKLTEKEHQPELEFDRQPELFDLPHSKSKIHE